MRTTRVLSVTLPEKMLKEAKKRAKKENRTMSELVREALRRYESVQALHELQAFGQARAKELGIREEDVDRLVHEDRAIRPQRAKGRSTLLERKAS